jgi:hypothetical protein
MPYIRSFRRYETKYLLSRPQCEAFLAAASELLIPDKYGDYTICNLYLDTDDFYFIEHSLDKPEYKEKLRLRSYGNINDGGKAFLEIKKKSRGIVYKRRITLSLHEAMDYLSNGKTPQTLPDWSARQIFSEIDYLMKKYKPEPKVYLAYDREAYFAPDVPELRVTFDRNIRSRWDGLSLSHDSGTSLLDTGVEDYRLMEIKCAEAVPTELAAVLSRMRIYPVSFSKYGNVYKRHLTHKEAIHEI